MPETKDKTTSLIVAFASILFIGLIVIGALWSGITFPSFRSELDRPVMEIDPEPPDNTPPWNLGQRKLHPPSGNLSELDLCTSKARNNLPKFIKAISSPTLTQSDFSVCVRKPTKNNSDGSALFWFSVVRTAPDRYSATIIPMYFGELYADDISRYRSCEIVDDEILDWLYFDDGKMVGGYTAGYFHRNR